MNIEVFCRRRTRIIHRHPDIHMVNRFAVGRPHLAEPHEHQIEIAVWANSPGEERLVDLLELQAKLDQMLSVRSPMNFDTRSFEQMCRWVYAGFEDQHRICRVQVEADGVEGAVLEWEVAS